MLCRAGSQHHAAPALTGQRARAHLPVHRPRLRIMLRRTIFRLGTRGSLETTWTTSFTRRWCGACIGRTCRLFREHLIRLDPETRYDRFGLQVSDDYLSRTMPSCASRPPPSPTAGSRTAPSAAHAELRVFPAREWDQHASRRRGGVQRRARVAAAWPRRRADAPRRAGSAQPARRPADDLLLAPQQGDAGAGPQVRGGPHIRSHRHHRQS